MQILVEVGQVAGRSARTEYTQTRGTIYRHDLRLVQMFGQAGATGRVMELGVRRAGAQTN